MLGLTSGLGGLIQPRDALVVSRHGEEKQNNTLHESNTIQTLVSVLCPQTLGALVLTAVSGHSPEGKALSALHTVPSPFPSTLSLGCWSRLGAPSPCGCSHPPWL